MSSALGESDYRLGGRERLREAFVLLEKEFYAGGVYLAGRAVECLLRAVIWKHDPEVRTGRTSLDAGHDLRELLTLATNLGVLRNNRHRAELAVNVQRVGRLWYNNMRYVQTSRIKAHWWRIGEIGPGRTLKTATRSYFEACSQIIKRCEELCAA